MKKLDAEIVDFVKEEEVEKTDMYMKDVYNVMAKLEEVVHKSLSRPVTTNSSSTASDDITTPWTKVKLPKLAIQSFKGELTAWVTFWDSYEVAIHTKSSLSDIEKFTYLRTFLQGPALEAIAGLTLTAANY